VIEASDGRFLIVPQLGYHTVQANLRAGLQAVNALCDVLDVSS
jgi:hypothetical protein